MKKNIPLLVYTHSDCSFIWHVLIDLINKYVDKEIDIHFVYNDSFKDIDKTQLTIF